MNTIHKAICTALGFAAVIQLAALGGDKKSEKASIERQERIISLREQLDAEVNFTIEVIRNKEGLDLLSINTSYLPANGEMYSIYICWLDEPATPGARLHEKRMVQTGRKRGSGRAPESEDGLSSTSFGTSSAGFYLDGRDRGGGQGDYYGSGRVCAMAVSNKGIYVSNIVTIPEKPEEAVKPQAEELRAGEDKAGIVPDKTNAGDGK